MRFRMLPVLAFGLILSLSACNLGAAPDEQPIEPDPGGRPTVEITSPQSGATYETDQEVLVSVNATDSVGVTRVQLFADGQIVKTVSSQEPDGEQNFTGVLDFVPRVEGDYRLRVLAFRGSVASAPDEIEISVRPEQIVVTQRPDTDDGSDGGGVTGPVIPDDGLCRALINVNLNLRSAPTTQVENVITVLPGGTLTLVNGRLGDNSWWRVTTSTNSGWVSGNPQYTTLYGNCLNVPVINVAPTPTWTPIFVPPTSTPLPTWTPIPSATSIPPPPDLIVPNISAPMTITLSGGVDPEVVVEIGVTIKNDGNQPAGQFRTRMRIDNQTFDLGVVGGLDPGVLVTLTQDVTFDTPGFYDIRVDVDIDNEVAESIETNNRGDISVEVVNP